jgi:hypothetical protein
MYTTSAIDLLRQVALSADYEKMNRSTVKGFLGELLVKARLEGEGVRVEHFGNQNGFDLSFPIAGKIVRADVKLSLPKDEFQWGFEYWGWALLHENKKKVISATHFICVGCSESLDLESIFVVRATDVSLFPKGIRQFSKVRHGLVVPRRAFQQGNTPPDTELYAASQRLLRDGVVKLIGSGQRLCDSCV